MAEVGARQLRADLAAHLRRAAAGETVTITVDGAPVAALGPVGNSSGGSVESLVASGALRGPRRALRPEAPRDPLTSLVTVRPEALFKGLR